MGTKKKSVILFTALLLLMTAFLQPELIHAAAEGTIIESGTEDRLIEQYGLEKPESSTSPSPGGMDVGTSHPALFFVTMNRLIVNPYLYMIPELIHHWIQWKVGSLHAE
ncbi:hypothetical protein [Paenibacillus sp. HW567]|uniref:hypothetical protein n=1 Tax=Paenibacillus sp. HW567 TaxID=1034769 RepID=UPI00035E825D|nr:hypothetical protein [Paenibacillus sp. HW567]